MTDIDQARECRRLRATLSPEECRLMLAIDRELRMTREQRERMREEGMET